jgi:tRNA pseudouridine32 synthase / 23S rRNA pseudouridine746 synthase
MSVSPLVFERQLLAEQDNQSAIDLLAQACPEVSKQKLKLAMKYGAVWLSEPASKSKPQKLRRAKRSIPKGASLFIYYNQQVLLGKIEPAQLIADHGSYSVWNKPSGMFSQGTKWGDHSAIVRWVELFGFELAQLPARETYLVHRLDRATNGLIIVAHSKSMATKLSQLFETRAIKKQYSAVVEGHFPVDKLTKFEMPIDGRPALTKILSADYCPQTQQTFLRLGLETGRKHQIRKHLACAGVAIKNDYLYGKQLELLAEGERSLTSGDPQPDLLLRSCLLEFICPANNTLVRFEIAGYQP